jgi:hypothetical protein
MEYKIVWVVKSFIKGGHVNKNKPKLMIENPKIHLKAVPFFFFDLQSVRQTKPSKWLE